MEITKQKLREGRAKVALQVKKKAPLLDEVKDQHSLKDQRNNT